MKQEIQGEWKDGPLFAIHPEPGISYIKLIRIYGLNPQECLKWDGEGSRGRNERDYIHLGVCEDDDYKAAFVQAVAKFGRPTDIPCPNVGCDWCLVDWKAGHYACPGDCNELFSPEEMEPIMKALARIKHERWAKASEDRTDAERLQDWLTSDGE